jgi:O-antigen ligase
MIAAVGSLAGMMVVIFAFAKTNTYMMEKYTKGSFENLDMVGRLDEFDDPEGEIFSSLVTRVSIWETALKRSQQDIWIGVGAADGKDELNQAYIDTNQVFLAKYKFPTHNQYIDFLLKFGVLGLCATIAYMLHILWISYRLKSSLIFMFFILFFTANLTDDFLIRFDGITFSALWISLFVGYYWRGHPDINRQGL